RAHEEGIGGLLIGVTGGEQLGHALLGRCQSGRARPASDARELAPGAFGPEHCPERLEDLECGLERLARRALLALAPLNGSQHEQRARALERLADAFVQRE